MFTRLYLLALAAQTAAEGGMSTGQLQRRFGGLQDLYGLPQTGKRPLTRFCACPAGSKLHRC